MCFLTQLASRHVYFRAEPRLRQAGSRHVARGRKHSVLLHPVSLLGWLVLKWPPWLSSLVLNPLSCSQSAMLSVKVPPDTCKFERPGQQRPPRAGEQMLIYLSQCLNTSGSGVG